MKKKTWTNEEIELLYENSNKGKKILTALLPDRKWSSIKLKIDRLGLNRINNVNYFTENEIEIIKLYHMSSKNELLKLLPNRTWNSIVKKIKTLGLQRKNLKNSWTTEEEIILKNCHNINELIINLPNKSKIQIYNKAKLLGIDLNDNWTEKEILLLKENYNKLNTDELIKLLPKRSSNSIRIKASKLNLKVDTIRRDLIDDEIIDLYINKQKSSTEIANILGASPGGIIKRLRKNNIKIRDNKFYRLGEKSHLWKGGITPEYYKIKSSPEYKQWRKLVFERDNYTCQCCGDNKGHNLNAHHILNFIDHPDLRFNIDNGKTLCDKCHLSNFKGSFHYIYGTHNNTKEQLEEYIQRFKSGEFDELRNQVS